MDYHRESIFTGQSVFWRFKIYAGKNRFFEPVTRSYFEQLLKVDIVFS